MACIGAGISDIIIVKSCYINVFYALLYNLYQCGETILAKKEIARRLRLAGIYFVKKGVEDMMKKTEETTKRKGMYLVATFGALALIALSALAVGVLNPKDKKPSERIDLNATPTPKLPTPTSAAKQERENDNATVPTQAPTAVPSDGQVTAAPPKGQDTVTEKPEDNRQQMAQVSPPAQVSEQTGAGTGEDENGVPVLNPEGIINELKFSEETGMLWPVTGEARIAFSPDHAIYHKTLDSYRTSDYVLLGGEPGTHVSAAADGIVTAVSEELKTGTTVTMQVSPDHEIIYGMLSDVTVKEGDFVNAGTVFATVAEPTRYFLEDGSGVYLQVLENEEAVNPMLYLH